MFEREGLEQQGTDPQLVGPVIRLGEGVAGHEHDTVGQARPAADERHEEGVPRHLRHMEIEQHQVHVRLVQHFVGELRVGGGHHVVAHPPEHPLQRPAQRGLVVDDQDPRFHDAAARRRGVVK